MKDIFIIYSRYPPTAFQFLVNRFTDMRGMKCVTVHWIT